MNNASEMNNADVIIDETTMNVWSNPMLSNSMRSNLMRRNRYGINPFSLWRRDRIAQNFDMSIIPLIPGFVDASGSDNASRGTPPSAPTSGSAGSANASNASNAYDASTTYERLHTMLDNVFTLLGSTNRIRNRIIHDSDELSLSSNILNQSFQQDKSKYKNVISDEGKEELKTVKYSKENTDIKNDTCPILHTPFEEDEEITQLPCNHCFDTNSITIWLQNEKAECPVCRYKLSSKEIKIEEEQRNNTQGAEPQGAEHQDAEQEQIEQERQRQRQRQRERERERERERYRYSEDDDSELQQAILNSIIQQSQQQ